MFSQFCQLLACSHCDGLLSEPVLLPCGETICKRHLARREVLEAKSISCRACGNHHLIPTKVFHENRVCPCNLKSKLSQFNLDSIERRGEAKEEVNKQIKLKKEANRINRKSTRLTSSHLS